MRERISPPMRRIVGLLGTGVFCAVLLLLPFLLERVLEGGWLLERYLGLGALIAYFVFAVTSGLSASAEFPIEGFGEPMPPKPMRLSDGSLVYLHLRRRKGEGW